MASFRVKETFSLNSRQCFVLAGEIIEGKVAAGMKILVPFNSATSMSAIIDSVEFVLRADGVEDVALCIPIDSPGELELWEALSICDETLEVVSATSTSN